MVFVFFIKPLIELIELRALKDFSRINIYNRSPVLAIDLWNRFVKKSIYLMSILPKHKLPLIVNFIQDNIRDRQNLFNL